MKIGMLITSLGNFGQKGFYNAQDIGLAKALDQIFDEVRIYKLVPGDNKAQLESISGCKNAYLHSIPAKSIGNNGFLNLSALDTNLDVLIYFADTQLILPKVYRWAKRNNVVFIPYIGVIESHSTSLLKKRVIDFLFIRNLRVYKKCHCLVKTPSVESRLMKLGVGLISVAPVGLDLSLLKQDYDKFPIDILKQKYGYVSNEKIILFIGRLTQEKQPVRMIDIFNEMRKTDNSYRLLMVGSGELKDTVASQIQKLNLNDYVKMIDRIPNSEIWELYRIADAYVNLNQQEIFGMAILEAMYYGCKVVAWKAPGPVYIIEDKVSGYLADSNVGIIDAVKYGKSMSEAAKQRIIDKFTWNATAKQIKSLILR